MEKGSNLSKIFMQKLSKNWEYARLEVKKKGLAAHMATRRDKA
jgi:hypothetical protein